VLTALIEKGLSRQKAYEIVQRNSMKAWKERTSFLGLLQADPEVGKHLSKSELKGLFDYQFFLRHVDEVFERLGLG
jgi:adenylosuccinate lyase